MKSMKQTNLGVQPRLLAGMSNNTHDSTMGISY